jgi:hypothetical protein
MPLVQLGGNRLSVAQALINLRNLSASGSSLYQHFVFVESPFSPVLDRLAEPTKRNARCQVRGEEGSVPAPDQFSRKGDLVPRWDQYRPGRVMVGGPGFREGSGSVLVRTLIYRKTSSEQHRKSVGALLEHESRTTPVL